MSPLAKGSRLARDTQVLSSKAFLQQVQQRLGSATLTYAGEDKRALMWLKFLPTTGAMLFVR
jgi:hypothetical protein